MSARRVLSFLAGSGIGVYLAQNYKIPNVEQLMLDGMSKLRNAMEEIKRQQDQQQHRPPPISDASFRGLKRYQPARDEDSDEEDEDDDDLDMD